MAIIGNYAGVHDLGTLYRLVGAPVQDSKSDAYFPIDGTGMKVTSALGAEYDIGGLKQIREDFLESFEAEIENHLNGVGGALVVAHRTRIRSLPLRANYKKHGLAGCTIPDEYLAYVYDAYLADGDEPGSLEPPDPERVGRKLDYDQNGDRFIGLDIPGVEEYVIRVRGRDVEVRPNRDAQLVAYLVTKKDAIEGIMPQLLPKINQGMVDAAWAAIRRYRELRGVTKQQAKEGAP
jgi:hypothetical protein